MKITLQEGFIKNGQQIKEVEMQEKITIGMEEQALDMCIMLGKQANILTAEMCSLSVATGLTYDDIRNLSSYDYQILRKNYNFFYNAPQKVKQEKQPLTQEQA